MLKIESETKLASVHPARNRPELGERHVRAQDGRNQTQNEAQAIREGVAETANQTEFSHLLSLIPYKDVSREKVKLPKRSDKGEYDDQATLEGRNHMPEND